MALADRIILSFGWRRRLIAFIAGAAGALAMAPLDLFPALMIPMTAAVWLMDGSSHGGKGAAQGLPTIQLHPMALPIVEAQRLHMVEPVERPGEAGGGILPTGEQNERG